MSATDVPAGLAKAHPGAYGPLKVPPLKGITAFGTRMICNVPDGGKPPARWRRDPDFPPPTRKPRKRNPKKARGGGATVSGPDIAQPQLALPLPQQHKVQIEHDDQAEYVLLDCDTCGQEARIRYQDDATADAAAAALELARQEAAAHSSDPAAHPLRDHIAGPFSTEVEAVYGDGATDGATFWPSQGKQIQPFAIGQQLSHSNRGPCTFQGLDEMTPNGETSWVMWPNGEGGMVTTRMLTAAEVEPAADKLADEHGYRAGMLTRPRDERRGWLASQLMDGPLTDRSDHIEAVANGMGVDLEGVSRYQSSGKRNIAEMLDRITDHVNAAEDTTTTDSIAGRLAALPAEDSSKAALERELTGLNKAKLLEVANKWGVPVSGRDSNEDIKNAMRRRIQYRLDTAAIMNTDLRSPVGPHGQTLPPPPERAPDWMHAAYEAQQAKAVRTMADFAMDLDEMFANEASEGAVRGTIAEVAPPELRETLAAVPMGELREALWRNVGQHRIERVGRAGDVVAFDPAIHREITGRPPTTGTSVLVLRPGTQIKDGALYRPADVVPHPPAA